MKYWITNSGNDKVIVITNDVIYNANPSRKKINSYTRELEKGNIPKQITGVPIYQIKSIRIDNHSDKIYIIKNNKDQDEIDLDTRNNKMEIFNYLKSEIFSDKKVLDYVQSVGTRLFKQIVPLAVILFFTFLTYSYAQDLEIGYEYQITGHRTRGVATGGILLGIADTLGSTGVLLLGTTLSLIPIYFMIQVIRTKKNITKIIIK
ncbi:hypothetical protein U6A24_17335 [Aquimarina gracilis]|uniref:RDD family protein n=1 Tax=Aquimarina gracilis TaxID=874422 RepID=A0ABU5ZZI1_9FLAO|nr:hypothetical protein [Aquimarina gracilis]MEB3347242.1 hypothetical protein [Aquimarina gracilis]